MPDSPENRPQQVRLLGFWVKPGFEHLPNPADLADPRWPQPESRRVADYLDRGQIAAVYDGESPCRLCPSPNGSRERTDGTYLWPEGLSHYVLEHGVRLPAEFLRHAGGWPRGPRDLARDMTWWQANAKLI